MNFARQRCLWNVSRSALLSGCVLLSGCALLAGCVFPQHRVEIADGRATEENGFERVIHIDEQGQVHRGDERISQQQTSKKPPPEEVKTRREQSAATETSAALNGGYAEALPEGASLSEESKRFHEELAALREPTLREPTLREPVLREPAPRESAPRETTPRETTPRETTETPLREPAAGQPADLRPPTAARRAAAATADPQTANGKPQSPIPPGVEPTVVRSKRFKLEYDDTLLGPDGIARVELYGTRDNGRTWERLGEDQDRRSPYEVEMDEDGLYGFRIAVAGKNGLASRPPKDGELPELWVKVDSDMPAFRGNLRASDGEVVLDDPEAPTDAEPSQAGKKREGSDSETSGADRNSEFAQASHHTDAPDGMENGNWRTHLARAITLLEDELAGGHMADQATSDSGDEQPQPLTEEEAARQAAQLRMLYLAGGKHEDAIRSSRHHSTEENEFWSHQMHSMHLLLSGDAELPASRRRAAALAELRDAADKLAAVSQLQIENLTFCTAAHSFGVFETSIDSDRWKHNDYREAKFEPEQPVVLYFEVHNFTSEQHTSREYPDGAWRTSLKGSYTILDRDGRPLDRRELKLRDDICRNRRHDYFVAYKTWMPQLNPGHYTLELLIEDAIAGKIGASTIDFQIVAR